MSPLLEICCGDIASVQAAVEGGADRIELCSGLEAGGLTPSSGLIRAAVRSGLPVNVLIRPRGGDFLYSHDEISVMEQDIICAIESDANGVVIGALTRNGDIDIETMERLIGATGNLDITFHRAFDLCRNPMKALEDIIALGCKTLLTSGQASRAEKGVELIAALQKKAGSRLQIMAGAGVNPDNAAYILQATGIEALHASASCNVKSDMQFIIEGVNMGRKDDEYSWTSTDRYVVEAIKTSMNQI